MHRSNVHLLNLPDEILLTILKKLSNVHVLYSLLNVNDRLDTLVQDKTFTNKLTFASMDDGALLDRFCGDILPRIRHRVKCLVLDSIWIERILLAADYSELTELQICSFRQQIAQCYFTDALGLYCLEKSPFRSTFQQRITKLVLVKADQVQITDSLKSYTTNVYSRILSFFTSLTNLSFVDQGVMSSPALSLHDFSTTVFMSSILTHLTISVDTFDDCLCLLDGRLNQLTVLSVVVYSVDGSSGRVHSKGSLVQLEHLSFKAPYQCEQHEKVISLVRQMINLNRLTLYLSVSCRRRVLDGVYVQHEILDYLPQLSSFTFYIGTYVDTTSLSSTIRNDDIQQTLANLPQDTASMVTYVTPVNAACAIFSLPFEFDYLRQVGNRFPNIVFSYVTFLVVDDLEPFKHEFFVRIARAFPLLKHLSVYNVDTPYWFEELPSFPSDDQPYSVIEYPHLTALDLRLAHRYYIDQFLNENKAFVPCLTDLGIRERDLRRKTHNFTREETRRNCAKIKRLFAWQSTENFNELSVYFLSLEMYRETVF